MVDDLEVESDGGAQSEGNPGTSNRAEDSRAERARIDDIKQGRRSARDILTKDLSERADRASVSLKGNLQGNILVELDNRDKFLFEWRDGKGQVSAAAKDSVADCTIKLSEQDLTKIAVGSLNPQIAMLSHKVNVAGRAELAVYFFNMLAPRA